jgi:hypothetical protein
MSFYIEKAKVGEKYYSSSLGAIFEFRYVSSWAYSIILVQLNGSDAYLTKSQYQDAALVSIKRTEMSK